MILELRNDADQMSYLTDFLQDKDQALLNIGHLGLLKRCLYSLECIDALIRLCSKSVKDVPDTELAMRVAEELNTFIRKSEETEA